MDFAINLNDNGQPQISLETADMLLNAVLLSLHIRRGSWFLNPNFGSRLHEVRTLPDSEIALAQEYATESLQWLRQIKRARDIDAEVTPAGDGWLDIEVVIDGAIINTKHKGSLTPVIIPPIPPPPIFTFKYIDEALGMERKISEGII
ncbi:MAG: hypothetical protein FWE57_04405 [Chitinispirillia bacterium]|nr:hypothetical protein [Chitinispirillia bacterium]